MSTWSNINRVQSLIRKLATSTDEEFKVNIALLDLTSDTSVVRPDTPRPTPLRIGVDMGGVCVHNASRYENNDDKFDPNLNMEGCVDALRLLSNTGHTIVLVSFCGRLRASNTRDMLLTKFPNLFDEIYFVKHNKFKHNIAISRGLDIMIDDRLSVLASMSTVTPIHFIADVPPNKRSCNKKRVLIEAGNWDAVVNEIANQRSKGYALSSHSDMICH
jgi:hypothetical protein